jgi:hypothetical protein
MGFCSGRKFTLHCHIIEPEFVPLRFVAVCGVPTLRLAVADAVATFPSHLHFLRNGQMLLFIAGEWARG